MHSLFISSLFLNELIDYYLFVLSIKLDKQSFVSRESILTPLAYAIVRQSMAGLL